LRPRVLHRVGTERPAEDQVAAQASIEYTAFVMNAPVANKQEVVERLQGASRRLLSFGVKGIGLFGSFVTGQQTPASDVDILVEFEPERHSFDNFMDLSFFLEEILGRRVEMLTPEGLSPHIGPHILREVERVPVAA
jgi:predicted nucleotidyltransferase